MKVLRRLRFGNPILREQTRQLSAAEIKSREIKLLIADMRHTLTKMDIGVGLAAPQVGESVAAAVIRIRPRKYRPNVKPADLVMINPKITKTFGNKVQQWEGCISSGPKDAALFAKVPRYKRLRLRYLDEKGKLHTRQFEGLLAHVIQHEVDHLNGVLFVDRVKDPTTYMSYSEYKKMVIKQSKK